MRSVWDCFRLSAEEHGCSQRKAAFIYILIFEKKDNHQLKQLNQQLFLNTLSPLPIDRKSFKTVSYCSEEEKKQKKTKT